MYEHQNKVEENLVKIVNVTIMTMNVAAYRYLALL